MSESEHTEPQHTEPPRHAFEFEGDDDVTDYVAQLPAIKMPTDEPFQRGTLLDLRVRVRVRGFGYDETRSGQVVRIHRLVLEECNIANVITPAMIKAAVEAEAAAAGQREEQPDDGHVITERPGPEDLAERPEEQAQQDDWSELSPEDRSERRRQDMESWDDPEQQEQQQEPLAGPLVVGEPDTEQAADLYEATNCF